MTYSAVAWAPATLVPDSSSDQGRSGGKVNSPGSFRKTGKDVRVEPSVTAWSGSRRGFGADGQVHTCHVVQVSI